jgi:hypothetical protein
VIAFDLDGRKVQADADPDTPLLWVIWEQFGLTGTKYVCGIAACGACTLHVDGEAVRSCSLRRAAGCSSTQGAGIEHAWRTARRRPPSVPTGRKPSYSREQLSKVHELFGRQTIGIVEIAKETGLTRQTAHLIKEDPAAAAAALELAKGKLSRAHVTG